MNKQITRKPEQTDSHQVNSSHQHVSRRGFIKSATTVAAIGSVSGGSSLVSAAPKQESASSDDGDLASSESRSIQAAVIRQSGARRHLVYTNGLQPQESNGDDGRYSDERYYASFTKTLPQNNLGEVAPDAYEALVAAVESEDPLDFDSIPLARVAERTLANPQGAFRFIFTGLDGHATRMREAPTFRSAESAAEMGEVYWLSLTRDIPFAQYGEHPLIAAAVEDLNDFSETVGPTDPDGNVTPDLLFRGSTPGDLVGPYISQFLWKDVPYGPSTIQQRYAEPTNGHDFMTTKPEWLLIQRGALPTQIQTYSNVPRYVYNNRMLGEYVHSDVLFQAYFNAMLVTLTYGPDAIDAGNPYGISITNQGGFTSLGGPWFIDLLTQAGNLALSGAWCQKWIHHRRLRPEVFAGRVHHHVNARANYELHPEILNSDALQRLHTRNGTYLLPMAYPEGSPTHPSYPAGHATVAGACVTVLKAVFNENFIIPDPVFSDNGFSLQPYNGESLTLGGEFNKLAHNIALGRDAAGVHYRSDGGDGLLVGEQQAIALLQDYSTTLNEEFGGFQFYSFDGSLITIINGEVS